MLPSDIIEFLGVTFNATKGTVAVSADRLEELLDLENHWLQKLTCTTKELECPIRKMQFVSACMRLGHIFIARMLKWITYADIL